MNAFLNQQHIFVRNPYIILGWSKPQNQFLLFILALIENIIKQSIFFSFFILCIFALKAYALTFSALITIFLIWKAFLNHSISFYLSCGCTNLIGSFIVSWLSTHRNITLLLLYLQTNYKMKFNMKGRVL